jgi:hypothetical protein
MNYWWLAGGVICLVTSFVHTFAGQADVVRPLARADLLAEPKATMHACWHIVTVTLFLCSAALLYAGLRPDEPGIELLGLFVGVQFVGYALVFLAVTLFGRWGTGLFYLPQWTLLLPIGALSIAGSCW